MEHIHEKCVKSPQHVQKRIVLLIVVDGRWSLTRAKRAAGGSSAEAGSGVRGVAHAAFALGGRVCSPQPMLFPWRRPTVNAASRRARSVKGKLAFPSTWRELIVRNGV